MRLYHISVESLYTVKWLSDVVRGKTGPTLMLNKVQSDEKVQF